jgi:hypothetical protein
MAAWATPGRHLVRRGILEVVSIDGATARALGHRVEALALGPLCRALDQALERHDDGNGLVSIARLELDLGTVPLSDLDTALPDAFAQALPAALTKALAVVRNGAAQEASAAAHLDTTTRAAETLVSLARTGRPPWWYDGPGTAAPTTLLADSLAQLVALAPERARAVLREVLGEPQARSRLSLHLDDAGIARCAALLVGQGGGGGSLPARRDAGVDGVENATQALLRELDAGFAPTAAGLLLSATRRRRLIRDALLAARLGPPADLEELARTLRARFAAVDHSSSPARDAAAGSARGTRPGRQELAVALHRAAERLGDAGLLLRILAASADGLPVAAVDSASTALDGLIAAGTEQVVDPVRLAAVLQPFLTAGAVDAAALEPALAPLRRRLLAAELTSATGSRPASTSPPASAGGIAVDNAGLCLLWPFLPTLFAQLALLDEARQCWRDAVAAHRAVALLDHLVTGEPAVDEARLPLAKVLCDLPLDAVHDPGEPVDTTERLALDGFLQAMLEHCRPLGQLSVEGLRGSWLLRPGFIEQRDGLPLLRVERRGYDILLDRLPWPREWVRLPWMPLPLRVEW